ncbi:MFS transporter [Vibrio sp. DNB22_10_4]
MVLQQSPLFVGTNADFAIHIVALVALLASVGAGLYGFWRVHELPIDKAHRQNHNQVGLITVLTWIGFIWHWVWVVAVFLAFVDLEKAVISIRDTWHGASENKLSDREV